MPLPLLALAVAGSALSAAGGLARSGAKPKYGRYTYVDPEKEQAKAIAANRKNFAEASRLAETTNEFSQEQLMEALRGVVPDINAINQSASSNIAAQLRGEIPTDVSESVSRSAAARSFTGGTAGSGFAGNLRTRDLGLTSLAQTQRGLDNASRWLASVRATQVAPQMDVTSMFLSPQSLVELKFRENGAELAQRNMVAQADAAYNPLNVLGGVLGQVGGAATGIGMNLYGAQMGASSGMSPLASNTALGSPYEAGLGALAAQSGVPSPFTASNF